MPRDKDKDNASWRGRRDRAPGHQAGAGREGEKSAKRGTGGKRFEGGRDDGKRRHRDRQDERPFRRRDDRAERKDFRSDDRPRKDFDRRELGDEKPWRRRENGPRAERKDYRSDRDRPRKDFDRRDRGDEKPWRRRENGPRAERKDYRGDRDAPRKDFDRRDRGEGKPWSRREDRPHEERAAEGRPHRVRAQEMRGREDRPKFGRPRFERREQEEERKGFVKRPAFGGRGTYRERSDTDRRPPREEARPKKAGERIAKVLARAGLASRRDAEEWIVQGRVSVNGRVINSPALDVTANDAIAVDGKPLPQRERTRLFLYHKPRGLMTTHADPEGRPTVFENLPEGLPRLISVGRLDFNTEGLLLLTNDGGLARVLELPETSWLRRYRVRAHGEVRQAQLDQLKNGVEVEGVKYGQIEATLEREQGANVWLVFAIREGKNREVRNVLSHLGLEVNRLIRISYGPFQLGELAEGEVTEVKSRVLREQLGDKIVAEAGADFATPAQPGGGEEERAVPRGKKPFKPTGKSALIADRKGRRVLVQRSGSEEARARNESEAHGYGPPRRPKRGYHGKRDLKPRGG